MFQMNETDFQATKKQMSTYKGDSLVMQSEEVDDEALAFIRAKKNVDALHKAKKMERTLGR